LKQIAVVFAFLCSRLYYSDTRCEGKRHNDGDYLFSYCAYVNVLAAFSTAMHDCCHSAIDTAAQHCCAACYLLQSTGYRGTWTWICFNSSHGISWRQCGV